MITMDYIVQPRQDDREVFYEYLIKNEYVPLNFTKDDFINMPFPFTISDKLKVFSILNSITCCAIASVNNKIITVEKYVSNDA